jgi:hypothetical protein
MREGWEQATEVARIARQHADKKGYKRKDCNPFCQDVGTPQ